MLAKWLTRSGALLVMVGFVLPSIATSCTTPFQAGTTHSLFELTNPEHIAVSQPLLYLVPVSMLLLLLLTFLQPRRRLQVQDNLMGASVAIAVSIFCLVLSMIMLVSDLFSKRLIPFPVWGAGVIVNGYALATTGIVLEWINFREIEFVKTTFTNRLPTASKVLKNRSTNEGPPIPNSHLARIAKNGHALAQLQMLSSSFLPNSAIEINNENYAIGRARENDLSLPDITVSRRHARLRLAQGTWFIQDLDSTSGIYVNDKRIQATKLRSGDVIFIGRNIFVFWDRNPSATNKQRK